MKHSLTFACFLGLSALCNTSSAQVTIAEGHAWSTHECLFWGGCTFGTHRILGDTMLEGIVYKKIHSLSIVGSHVPVVGAREDVENQKVYFHDGYEEHLAYDFSLEQGDVFNIHCGSQPTEVVMVDSVEMLNGEIRKRIHFPEEIWIEGIGSSKGLTAPFFDLCLFDVSSETMCFYAGIDQLWQGEEFTDCGFDPLSTNGAPLNGFTVYPNPARDKATLHFSNVTQTNDLIQLLSMDGRSIRSLHPGAVQSMLIDLQDLPAGMYLVQLLGSTGASTARVVKE